MKLCLVQKWWWNYINSSITRAQDGTTATAHSNGATVELYQLNGIPLTRLIKLILLLQIKT